MVFGIKMWLTVVLLLLSSICYSHCTVTWISPTDGTNVTINEDHAVSSEVVGLNATTTDSTITFTIMEQTPNQNKFAIQNGNELYLRAELDFEDTQSYTVLLKAFDSSTNVDADITISVQILDVNDNEPKITSATSITVPTDTTIGSVVYTVTAEDADTVGTITYSINSGNENQDFIINATTGEIFLNSTLDISNIAEYDLLVAATDGVSTDEKEVTVYLTDVIWQNPQNNETRSLPENTSIDSVVVELAADQAVLYTFRETPDGSVFRLKNSNQLTLVEALDFETIQTYTLSLKGLANSGRSAEITYTVVVTDVNDEPLIFSSDTDTIDLSKDTDIGTLVYTAETTDPDTVGIASYTIADGNTNGDFSINDTTGQVTLENALNTGVTGTYTLSIAATDGVFNATLTLTVTVNEVVWVEPVKGTIDAVPENTMTKVTNLTADTAVSYIIQSVTPDEGKFDIQSNELVLTSELDYETTTQYVLVLKAIDTNGKSATVTYTVNVTDVNDIAPVFQSSEFIAVSEDTPVDSPIYSAFASDRDTVGTIAYSLTGGNTDNKFSIDSSSGNLSLSSALSPASTDDLTYSLVIEADDSVHQVTLSLGVTVKTVPALVLPENGTTIRETVDASGTLEVLNLTSTDLDNDPNPEYSIVSQSHPGTFVISDGTKLVTTAVFDYETTTQYNVTLSVTDTSKFGLSSQETLQVYIINENDEKPNFTSEATLYLADDTATGTSIYTTETNDPDNMGSATYSIIDGNPNSDFNIDANGNITLANALNASATLAYNLTIQANDSVNTETFVLAVNLVTEPQIDSPDPNITLDEGSYTSHPVYNLSSTDIDNDPTPTYAIVSQSVNGTFILSGDNTQLMTSATFDYENVTSYTVTLSVTDSSSLQRSSTATVTVYINNLNDEPPVFTSPTELEVPEDTSIGVIVYNASTTDPDSPSVNVTYLIIGGNTENAFEIDSASGSITVAQQLSNFSTLIYSLVIQANDTVNTGTHTLNVSVVTAPIFAFPDYNITITENTNTTGGYHLWEFNSTDLDNDLNPTYGIVSQSDPGTFEISDDGTTLVTMAAFDYETKNIYNVTLSVTDTFGMSTEATLNVYVTDENDNNPEFQSNDTFEISELAAVGAGVYTAITTDQDTESVVSYAIIDGNTDNTFSINETSGEVTLASELRPDETLSYNLVLQANDSILASTFNVTAVVKTAPKFNISSNITIPEDQDTSSTFTVLLLESTDPDGDTGVTYEIVSQSVDSTFEINGENLTTNVTLDYETTPNYTVTLRATDDSMFSLSSTFYLTVIIEDANDLPPVFTSDVTTDIPETIAINTMFYTAVATDEDTVGTVTYSITGGNAGGHFSIDADSGNLTIVNKSITGLVHNLTIQANDTINTEQLNLTVNFKTVPVLNALHINISETDEAYVVWNLTSSDVDGDTNPNYTIIAQSEPDTFYINDTESAVVTNATFDYESIQEYTFAVLVTDSSLMKLSSSATFTVSIINENDESPKINSSAEIRLREDTAINSTVVYTAVATDADNLGNITFAFIGGNDENIFTIDDVTGNVTLTQNLNASATLSHVLVLQANDSLNIDTLNVTFTLSTAPVIIVPEQVTVVENVDIATDVMTLNATDLDGDTDFVFVIVSQSEPGTFMISEDNTKLITNASIDYDAVQNYNISIKVTDVSEFNMTSTTDIHVNVIDVNDEKPVFTSDNTTVVAENVPTGTAFYIAVAEDVDTSGNVTYSITDGNADGYFGIDPLNGSVTVEMALQPSTADDLTRTLVIQANDSVNAETLNLTVKIQTVPVINVIDRYLPEDFNNSNPVWTINSTDLDGDNNTFTITDQSEADVFTINGDGIFTNTSFDYETTKNYTVSINVTDSSELSLSSVETLNIYIVDVNDNVPTITSNTSVHVLQTAKIDEVIYNTTTEDPDTVGNVTYTITAGNRNNDFDIGIISGEVTLKNELNPQSESDILYHLLIEANDTKNTDTLNLTVMIRTAPKFNISSNVTIPEDQDTSSTFTVLLLESTDLDGDTGVTYEIVSQSVDSTFEINGANLTTNVTLDYETTPNYTVTLRATDDSMFSLSSTFNLTVIIEDANDLPPVFTFDVTVDTPETIAINTVFYTAVATDEDTIGTITYSIIGGNAGGHFSIDVDSGNLTIVNKSVISRVHNLTIQANDTINTEQLNLTVNFKTVPVLNATLHIFISETDEAYVVWNLTSSDVDGDTNPNYTIIAQSEPDTFYINDTESAVVTNATFDYESIQEYTFAVLVADSSLLKLSSSATFTISIINENDESPEINSSAEVRLREDTAINSTVVYTAEATDADNLGNITFAFIGWNDENIFAIDDVSGNVTLTQNLNSSATLSHVLVLQANDSLNIDTLNVTFTLSTAPVIIVPDQVTVVENVAIPTDVMTLNATDLDGDTDFVFAIVSQSEPGTFMISEDNTKLRTNASIDYNSVQNYNISIKVTDMSEFNMTSTTDIQVNVIDDNDKKPVFTSDNTTVIAENTPTGTAFYVATAEDVDTIGNITYSITDGNADGYFSIDPLNGSVTVEMTLQPSTADDLTRTLVIQANDSVNTETLNLTVKIQTVPVINVIDLYLREDFNTTNGYPVWTINSTDLDGDNNTFTITDQSEADVFTINGDGIFTNTSFDFETTKNYTVSINVTDSSELALSSVETLYIYIKDVNDNVPTITSNTSVHVLQTAKIDEVIYKTTTEDPDTEGNVTYALTAGNRNNDFDIGMVSGEVTLKNKLNPQSESDILYHLLIEANDTKNTDTLNLTVMIRTVPYLNITNQSIAENTDTSGPYTVWPIEWNDLDLDPNPTFDIVVESVDGTFQIVNNSVLVTNASFDFENATEYTATISVTDMYNLTSNGTLTLTVTDENDVTPVFTSNTTLDLWENSPTGEVVYKALADDPDTKGAPEFSITDGNSESKFVIDAASGNLTLSSALNFGTTPSYTLQITANDSVNTATFNLTVNVKTSPELNFTGTTQEIPEDAQSSFEVLVLNATDRDGDTDPQYTITSQSVDGTFVIDGDKLVTNATFDYEDVNNYTVTIRVTDSSLGLTASDTLTVLVTDVNDNAPNFTSVTEQEIREDTSVDTVVYVAKAEDLDSKGQLSFSIKGGDPNNYFGIDSNSGNVTLNKSLNPETQISYSLELEVNDTALTDTLVLNVSVVTAPRMKFPDDNVTIDENAITSGNYSVLDLNFTDLDGDVDPTYEIVNQSVPDTFFISSDNARLETTAQFNYSDVNVFEVTLRVTDSSTFTMSSIDALTVYITDANDVPPIFTSPDTLEIPENQETGSVVYNATATDVDTEGEIFFEIIGGNTNEDFSIDSQSGHLTLVKDLQPSVILEYALEIQANDSVNIASLNLTVSVKTIPEIVLPDRNVSLQEDIDTSGTYTVLELNSTDLDNDPNPVYTILSQTVNDTFNIVNDTLLVTTATFDFESVQSYTTVIQVTDTSSFALSSSVTLTVSILDANDMAPVFTSDTDIYIPEETNIGKVVYTANTYDNDTSGTITYSVIGGNINSDFSIDGTSGAVTLQKELRPGNVPTYTLRIQANDTANQAVLNLTVNVVTAPKINPPEITIVENVNKSFDSLVWICNSQDVDGDQNPVYAIVSQSVNDTFVLNDENTRIITTETFDYENKKEYQIVVSVTDTSPLTLSSTSTFTVSIVNVNDEAPEFTSPATVKLLENTETGSVVYTAEAEDADQDGNNITFTIIGGDPNNDFTIDAASGNVTLVNALNTTTTPNYTLVIQANDTLNTANVTVTIDVKPDIDECQSNPCQHGASCIDGIEEYTCDCNHGYNGTNCEIDINECASNPCQNGATCQQGINEYNCTCPDGFRGNNCEKGRPVVTTTAVPPTKRKISSAVVFGITLPENVDLNVTLTYIRYEEEIRTKLQIKLNLQNSVVILDIRRGSTIVDFEVIVDEDAVPDVSLAIADLASNKDEFQIFNQTGNVTLLEVNNEPVPIGQRDSDAVKCLVYEAFAGKCTGDYVCSITDSKAGCERKDSEDNLPLILGLGIGVPAFFVGLAIVVLCIAYYNNKRKTLKQRYRRDMDETEEYYKMPIRANTGPPTWPFVASPEQAEFTAYGDYSSRDGSHRMYAEEFNGQYDNQVDRDANHTWDYLFTHLRPGEPYHIQRPKYNQ